MAGYTTDLRIEMKNEEMAKAVCKEVAKVMRTQNVNKERIEEFIEDLKVEKSNVIVECSFTLFDDEFEIAMKDIFKAVAEMNDVEEFVAESNWMTTSCGAEIFIDANYKKETLEIKTIGGEDFMGCCEECGENIVNYFELDGRETYICEE